MNARCNRHWFAYYGQPGTSAPTCRRCGVPNPKYRPEYDSRAIDAARASIADIRTWAESAPIDNRPDDDPPLSVGTKIGIAAIAVVWTAALFHQELAATFGGV